MQRKGDSVYEKLSIAGLKKEGATEKPLKGEINPLPKASTETEPQSHNHKELNSANNKNESGRMSFPRASKEEPS